MNIGEAISAVIQNPKETYVTDDGWTVEMDCDRDIMVRNPEGGLCEYMKPHVYKKTWHKKEAQWVECSQDQAIEALQDGGYEVETKADVFVWKPVKMWNNVVLLFAGGTPVSIRTDRKWRFRKVTT